MVKSKVMYEELRRKRLEENKKRMEELNLKNLSHALHSPSAKSSPAKLGKHRLPRPPMVLTPVRRSSRVKDLPPVSYKEAIAEPLERMRRTYSGSRKNLLNRVYASDEIRTYAIERADKVKSGLGSKFPSFVKPMLQSHVTGGFWLGLPVHFCKKHLPLCDELIYLEDETGEEFETKYLAEKTGLSAGWRGFSIAHELVDGDALVFHLVMPTKFKVYIIRAYEVDDEQKHKRKEDSAKDLDVTHLDRIAKRVRAGRR